MAINYASHYSQRLMESYGSRGLAHTSTAYTYRQPVQPITHTDLSSWMFWSTVAGLLIVELPILILLAVFE